MSAQTTTTESVTSPNPTRNVSVPLRRRLFRPGTLVMLVLCGIVAFLFVWPVVMLAAGAFRTAAPGLGGEWTVSGLVDAYTDPATYRTLLNSLIYTFGVQVFVVFGSVFFAWMVARTNTPLRRIVTPMMVLVFATPTLFFAISWGMLGNDPAGLLNVLFRWLTGTEAALLNINSWYGLIGVTVLKFTSAAYLLMIGPFMALDRSLEEASTISGAGRIRTFFLVDVPVLAPAITGLVVLGLGITMGVLDLPLLLGTPAGIEVFPTEIFSYINNSTPANYSAASSLSMLLVAVMVVLLFARERVLRGRQFVTVTGRSYSRERTDIGKWRYLTAAAIVVYGLLAFVLPLAQLVMGSLQPLFGLYGRFTLEHYRTALSSSEVVGALGNTIAIGVIGGLVATTLSLVVSYGYHRSRSSLRGIPYYGVWTLVAVPGVVLGLSMAWAYLTVPGLRNLYATVWIVMIALIAAITPIAARATDGAVVQISHELEEAARISGASSSRAMVDIVGRLILPSFFAGWFISGTLAAGNLDVPILLSSPSNRTIPILVYEQYSSGRWAQAAAVFCLVLGLIAAILVAAAVARWLLRLSGWRRRPASPLPPDPLDVMSVEPSSTHGGRARWSTAHDDAGGGS